LSGGLAEMMLQSSLDWLWKLVVWGGLEFKMYIFKVVWFGFGPVAQTTTRERNSDDTRRRQLGWQYFMNHE